MTLFDLAVRQAFKSLPQEQAHLATRAPRWAEVFTPQDHQDALDPDRSVVVGDRGTGKSFWSSVLVHQDIRNIVAKRYPRLRLDKVDARLGFSDAEIAAAHPGQSEIAGLIGAGYSAEDLWRAVLLGLAPEPPASIPASSEGWKQMVDWVVADPARRNAEFQSLDEAMTRAGKTYVLIFDALDVIGDNWKAIRLHLEGLIKLTLAVRALRSVRIKLFIRPDMADDRRLWQIGDASKLRHREVQLAWKRRDLYGLLWTLLANPSDQADNQAAKIFRESCSAVLSTPFDYEDESWRPPYILVEDENRQQEIFHKIAGPYMGAGSNKGNTYRWVTNHLSDAAGLAAPRSFILAMQQAAKQAKSTDTVLDKAGIESGVRTASKIRVEELSEDYRWMDTVLSAMEGLVVPITAQALIQRWSEKRVRSELKNLSHQETQDRRFIPPGDVLATEDETEAYVKLIEQLKRLKIFLGLSDGRINMPDLFRLQANIKRKGGMKPRA